MVAKLETRCPLCGARLSAAAILDAAESLIAPALGVIDVHCPHCQGYLEARPTAGQVDIGYVGEGGNTSFEVALSVAYDGLAVDLQASPSRLSVVAPGRSWVFEP